MCGRCLFNTRPDGVLKGFASGIVLRIETRLLDKCPHAFHEIQVWRLRRSVHEHQASCLCPGLYQRTPLIASVVQHDGHRDAWRCTSPQVSQRTNRFSRNRRQMLDGADFVCDRVQGRQPLNALAARRRFAQQAFNTPANPHERGTHDMGRLHHEDGALASLGFSSPRLQRIF
jgi:hypothetical protein